MAESGGQERTEQATPKRLQQARDKGQIPRSKELNTLSAMLVAAAGFMFLGSDILQGLTDLLKQNLTISREKIFDTSYLVPHFLYNIVSAMTILAPFFILMVFVAILSAVALGGWSFSAQALALKLERLDPVKGMGRVFSWRGIMEMLKGLAKFVLVSVATIILLRSQVDTFLGIGVEPLKQGLAHSGQLLVWSFLLVSMALIFVVLVDVPFQLWDHQRQLKMTRQEVRDENKQTEGSPEVKARIRRTQMEMAQQRMLDEVPKADVVVTNPEHYAVALKYEQNEMDAPVVVAKGADHMAQKIKELAQKSDVPILSAPPLARAIYRSTELNEAIPAGLYRAVAQVLAYIYQIQQGPLYNSDAGVSLDDLPIPDDLRWDD